MKRSFDSNQNAIFIFGSSEGKGSKKLSKKCRQNKAMSKTVKQKSKSVICSMNECPARSLWTGKFLGNCNFLGRPHFNRPKLRSIWGQHKNQPTIWVNRLSYFGAKCLIVKRFQNTIYNTNLFLLQKMPNVNASGTMSWVARSFKPRRKWIARNAKNSVLSKKTPWSTRGVYTMKKTQTERVRKTNCF